MPRLRDAIPSDLASLGDLARTTFTDSFGHTFQPGDLEAHLETRLSDDCVAGWMLSDRVLVAVDGDGRLVGFAHFGAAAPGGFAGHARRGDVALNRLYVAPLAREMGLGTMLLVRVLAAAPEAANVLLDVWEENTRAQQLYARHGFVTVDRKVFETKSGQGAGYDLVMVRRAAAD